MHGGLFSKDDIKLDDIRAVDRCRQPPEEGIMCELLWSDPQPMYGRYVYCTVDKFDFNRYLSLRF